LQHAGAVDRKREDRAAIASASREARFDVDRLLCGGQRLLAAEVRKVVPEVIQARREIGEEGMLPPTRIP
jgi:hypothetical protein